MEPIDPHDWDIELRRYGDPRLGGVYVVQSSARPAFFRLGGGPGLHARLKAAGAEPRGPRADRLAPWRPVWIRALPHRTPQELEHARKALACAMETCADFLDAHTFARKLPDDAEKLAACADACAAQAEVACHLGPADDKKLRRRVQNALRRANGRPRFLAWLDLGGPQPIVRREWWFDGRRLLLESEAHAGLILRGPPDLIGRVTGLLGAVAT
ncbi:hypothetical protein [Caulobacter sp. 17J65-9]|uniref:hypothetical protein n=1 Tax=Caulobacter sp. 17J65-9 TaxID=2709382 RepID=UPI0013C82A45|nr:hypothetical protein [Caulobacter sp. 17J65-9]NEX91869.1 hypothetical protein [Caulobacter sp. 17J65-9]